jgi:hypothetical protein
MSQVFYTIMSSSLMKHKKVLILGRHCLPVNNVPGLFWVRWSGEAHENSCWREAISCEQCPKSFSESLERNHLVVQCPKSFSEMHCLGVHTRTHTGEAPVACEQCTRSFSESGDLTKHMRTHAGEKPFRVNNVQSLFPSHWRETIRFKKKEDQNSTWLAYGQLYIFTVHCTTRFLYLTIPLNIMNELTGN